MQKASLKNIIPLKSYSTLSNQFCVDFSPLPSLQIVRRRKNFKVKVVPLDVFSQPSKFGTTFLEHSVEYEKVYIHGKFSSFL